MFSSFVAHCNTNELGLSFTHVLDPTELVFLDLVLSHDKQDIVTSNHTKPTSANSYLHFDSCHHSTRQMNIPNGQFHRLRRNYSRLVDYTTQGKHMQRKFEEKGYPRDLVQDAFVSHMDMPSKPKDTTDRQPDNTARFVSTFNTKCRTISKIINKHYKILLLLIKNILAPSKLQSSNKRPLFDINAYFDTRTGIFQ